MSDPLSRPPRICPAPGCPLPSDECRVPSHTGRGWKPDRVRGTRHERGYGSDWDRVRRRILRRDPWCRVCGREKSREVDHLVPKSRGGDDSEDNLRGVCPGCHSTKTKSEAARARRTKNDHSIDPVIDEENLTEGGGTPLGESPGPVGARARAHYGSPDPDEDQKEKSE